MSWKNRTPTLNELVFQQRNRDYGAFMLRTRYLRYLTISVISGILILLFLVLIPFIYVYYEPVIIMEDDYLIEVNYTVLPLPEDNMLNLSLPKPAAVTQEIPVIRDSVRPEEVRQVLPAEPEEQKVPDDTTGKGTGGTGTQEGTGEGTALTAQIDIYPRFPGGDPARHAYLRQNLRYPSEALKKMIQGTVIVVFVVEVDGSVSNVSISKSIGGGCDEEAVRVVKEMPPWEPGLRSGRAVRVMLRMPIVFRITGRSGS